MMKFTADAYKYIRVNGIDCLQGQRYDIARDAMRPSWTVFVPETGDFRIICKTWRTSCTWYAVDSYGEVLVQVHDESFDVNTALAALTQSLMHLLELTEELAGIGNVSWNDYTRTSWEVFLLSDMAYTAMH